jgi:hypothetical protein
LTLALFSFAIIQFWRRSKFQKFIIKGFDRVIETFGYAFPLLLIVFGLLILGPYIKTMTYVPGEEIPERLSPIIYYIASRLVQLIIVSTLFISAKDKVGKLIKDINLTRNATLSVFAMILGGAYLSINIVKEITQHREVWRLSRYVDLTYEMNLPAFFSAFLLGLAGTTIWVIYRKKIVQNGPYIFHWFTLSITFFFLALDETFELHEQLGWIATKYIGRENLLFEDWAYVAIPLVILFGTIFFRFFTHLPLREKRGFSLAAFLYVGGALGVEIIGSAFFIKFGFHQGTIYILLTTIEEVTEMVGVIYFIHVLKVYLDSLNEEIQSNKTFSFKTK